MISQTLPFVVLLIALGAQGLTATAQTPPPEPPRETQRTAEPLLVQPASVDADSGVMLDRNADYAPAAVVAEPAKLDPQSSGGDARSAITPPGPAAAALRALVEGLSDGTTDEEKAERAALLAFYGARAGEPLWFSVDGITPKGQAALGELKRANDWGLDSRDFDLSGLELGSAGTVVLSPESVAQNEVLVSQAILKYGRYARGGRIVNPAEQLSSYLDRRPQLLSPKIMIEQIAAAEAPDGALRSLHPQHPQFEQLRQAYLTALAQSSKGRRAGTDAAEAKRILANMEQWRWMPANLGPFYVWNNLPEYTQRIVKDGEVIQTERIVAGELSKQTPIFSRPMRRVTFKPTWKVPDSIKANELWPSLLRGGGLMNSWALQMQTKDGQPVDWRKIDWSKTDILAYDVIQVTGPKNVLGKVKFSFPNPHTVFMHDTLERDKYMFNIGQRAFSHGCMRVRNPMRLAEALLAHDKGWTAQQVNEAYSLGPLNNEIALDQKVPVHTTYFTAWVGTDGKLQTARDTYGHERRITQALDGKWSQIVKGRDHLAPVAVNLAAATSHKRVGPDGEALPATRTGTTPTSRQRRGIAKPGGNDFFGSFFGGF